jgi:uncharacterized protein DUF4349
MATNRSTRTLRLRLAAAIAVGAIALGACSGSGGDDSGALAGRGGGEGGQAEPRPAADQFSSHGPGLSAAGAGLDGSTLPAVGPRVVKRAKLELEVPRDEFQKAVGAATSIAGDHAGFVLTTEVSDAKGGFGTVVVRVPATEFEVALDEIKELGEVESERVSGEDVSQEFVDLEARLRNFTAQEAVLLRLMDQAQTVGATIRVQRELTDVQLEVERIRGRLRWIQDQTDFSTITIDLREAGAVIAKTSTLEQAWQNAGSVFLAIISGVIVAAGAMLPVALLALVALVIFKLLRPRFGRKTESVEM